MREALFVNWKSTLVAIGIGILGIIQGGHFASFKDALSDFHVQVCALGLILGIVAKDSGNNSKNDGTGTPGTAAKLIIGALFLGLAAPQAAVAQTPTAVSLLKQLCPNADPTKPRVLMFSNVAGISVPVCAVLGSGLTLTNGTLSAATTAAPTFPQVETFNLDPAITPLTQTTLNYALAKAPAPNTFLVVIFRSISWPGDAVYFVANPQQSLIITLPMNRSNQSGDTITFAYMSSN